MDLYALFAQLINAWASASSLFLAAAGLTLIFGVTRIINFAHGSFFMLGMYTAYSLIKFLGPYLLLTYGLPMGLSYWIAILATGPLIGFVGLMTEIFILRRIYKSPELVQLLATFAVVLVLNDASLFAFGPEDLMGPRVPGMGSSVELFSRPVPVYDLFLIVLGPLVLTVIWWILKRTRTGLYIRAASTDKETLQALGVNSNTLFTAVFCAGCMLAGWAGALELVRTPANLGIDLSVVTDCFVVVVIAGMGSITGAYFCAILLGVVKALCITVGSQTILGLSFEFSKLTLVTEFILMALILIFRPSGLFNTSANDFEEKANKSAYSSAYLYVYAKAPHLGFGSKTRGIKQFLKNIRWYFVALIFVGLCLLPLIVPQNSYVLILAIDVLIAVLFAASLHFLVSTGGLISFGHAAYFGVGAYASALLFKEQGFSMEECLLIAPLIGMCFGGLLGWLCTRLSGIYLAMLTLALAQLLWAICFQWDGFTGGSNGLSGIWPSEFWSTGQRFYELTLVLVALSLLFIQLLIRSPFGLTLKATRDSAKRALSLGVNVKTTQLIAFAVSAAFAGLAGALFAFSKGSISPDVLSLSRSVDSLVMVLLGGINSSLGPILGALSYTVLQDFAARDTEYWRACLGALILLLLFVLPNGLASVIQIFRRSRGKALQH